VQCKLAEHREVQEVAANPTLNQRCKEGVLSAGGKGITLADMDRKKRREASRFAVHEPLAESETTPRRCGFG